MQKAYLVLADGQVFEGLRIGADGDAMGELVFTTGMCGYLETLSDPCFYGQIVTQTFPLVGNYGVIPADLESTARVRGYVVREACDAPSNFRSEGSLSPWLRAQNIAGICGIDTRRLTAILREQGVMNALICDEVPADLTALRAYTVTDAVQHVTHTVSDVVPAQGEKKFRVALLDCGVRRSVVRELTKRGCTVTILPADTAAAAILETAPDGVVLSDGPGNPAENAALIWEVGKLMGHVPLFGMGLGHQLMALTQGGQTEKLKCGHRGANQPVREVSGTRTYITTQNHGYTVLPETLRTGTVNFVNANDGTCEGIDYPALGAFSVQFQPQSCDKAGNTAFLFDRFISILGGSSHAIGYID